MLKRGKNITKMSDSTKNNKSTIISIVSTIVVALCGPWLYNKRESIKNKIANKKHKENKLK